jgi:uncharacterized membrane protein YdbT with pleckstrin-like domain
MALDLFPDYFDHPEGFRFIDQEEDENIELLLREHWITNVPWIVIVTLGLLFPVFLIQIDQALGLEMLVQVPGNILFGLLVVWYLLMLGYVVENFLNWYFNIYIVTNRHIVDINFVSLLSRDMVSARLDDVQNVSSKIQGIFESTFNYGDVLVETAGESKNQTFTNVSHPDAVADRIQDLQENQEKRGNDVT